ncbi:hypothetical protein F3Y22_tig00110684pilonHSYRG00117 [Hibiscus syriacus]|uniref:Uncharacterized protein n=1 Tax=Hibiscus syriacus TaxID=106335 RepID=A0A6A2ZV19_HIBSY|nr:hypothetical protein F3Y22_tig00110684pilonHSYRG00117 [Hibiscus syriacus]
MTGHGGLIGWWCAVASRGLGRAVGGMVTSRSGSGSGLDSGQILPTPVSLSENSEPEMAITISSQPGTASSILTFVPVS